MKQEFSLEIDYKSFYLRPDTPPEGIVREPREGSEPGAPLDGHLGEAAVDTGLTMRRAPITPNSRLSFEAGEFAKEKRLFEEFHRACYQAFWEDGANLGDLEVLQQLAQQVGLDAQEMQERLDSGDYTARTQAQYEEALHLGVRGIPSFIVGRYHFSGAQPYQLFQQVAQRAQAEQAGLVLPS